MCRYRCGDSRILKSLCEKYGVAYAEKVESYTSKASFLDKDSLPEYIPGNTADFTFSGKRIKRGLYRTQDGRIIHADINGAANIIRKYQPNADFSVLDSGILLNPRRMRVLNIARKKLVAQKSNAAA